MDLNAPLGIEPPRKPRPASPGRNLGLIVGSGIVLACVAGLGLLLAFADPRGGRSLSRRDDPAAGALAPGR